MNAAVSLESGYTSSRLREVMVGKVNGRDRPACTLSGTY